MSKKSRSYTSRVRLGDFWPEGPRCDALPDIIIHPEPIESWAQKRRRALWLADPHCIWCGFLFVHPDFATVEHLVPRGYGGSNAIPNTRLACGICNEKRGNWYNKMICVRGRRRSPCSARDRLLPVITGGSNE